MPELPEVTIIVNSLNKKIVGLVLDSVEYDWPKKFDWGKYSPKDLKGAKVLVVRRLGKIVIINLLNDKRLTTKTSGVSPSASDLKLSILIHLKLTGQLIYQDKKTRVAGGHPIPPLGLPVPNKTTRVTFTFTNGGHLYFNDLRKFGWVKIVSTEENKIKEAIGTELGPDPLEVSFEEFVQRLTKRGQARIKKLLMDQSFMAGVGNIYSDEALWRAKIHPQSSVISLTNEEIKELYHGIRESLKLAVEKGGSSANTFVDSSGEKGLYLSFAKAYHLTGKPCVRCGTLIVRKKIDGRSAHFCPQCQKLK